MPTASGCRKESTSRGICFRLGNDLINKYQQFIFRLLKEQRDFHIKKKKKKNARGRYDVGAAEVLPAVPAKADKLEADPLFGAIGSAASNANCVGRHSHLHSKNWGQSAGASCP